MLKQLRDDDWILPAYLHITHITPVLQQLHWLPVRQRVQFKIAVLAHNALHDLLRTWRKIADLCLSLDSRRLRSSDIDKCLMQ